MTGANFSQKSLCELLQNNGLKTVKIKKYVSEIAPPLIKKMAKGPFRNYFSERFSGRTITILGRKQPNGSLSVTRIPNNVREVDACV
jgi:hypothetical protein